MLEKLTRIGFGSKGIVYFIVGLLAALAAFGRGGQTTGKEGAITKLADQPFGEFALILIAAGLAAYAFWRLLCAVADTEGEGNSAKGLAKRVGYMVSALVYGGASWYSAKLLMGSATGKGHSAESLTADFMSAPAGPILVMLAGTAVIIAGIMQMREGWQERFRKHLRMAEMSRAEARTALRAGRLGYMARGVVFAIIGALLLTAGLQSDPRRAGGLEDALDTLAAQPYGQVLLAIVASGLICYGVYCGFEARYRRVRT